MNKQEFITTFFSELNLQNVDYFVLGEYKELPKSTGNSDLDIVVSKNDIDQTTTILNEILENNQIRLISFYTNNNALFYRLAGKSEDFWGIQIDLFYKGLFFQNKEYYPTKNLYDDVIVYNGIKVLDIKKAYFTGFLKEIIHNGHSKLKYIKGFIDEVESKKEKYKIELQKLYGPKFKMFVFNNLSEDKLKNISSALRNLMIKKIYGWPFSKTRIFFSKLNYFKRIYKRPGFTIAVLGTDGSGKTTIIDAIIKPLNEAVHNSVYYEHMRPNLIPNIAQLFGEKKPEGPTTNPHAAKPSGFIGSIIRLFYYSFDYIIGYWVKVYPSIIKNSSIWIFDRYYYDYLIDQKRAKINLPKSIIKGVGVFIPKPDIIICLGTDPEKIHKRKPELPLEEVKYQVNKLKSFCDGEKRAVWIDTGTSIKSSVDETINVIVNSMAKRYH